MQVEVTADLAPSASASAGGGVAYVLSANLAPASDLSPGGGVATNLVANAGGDATLYADALPINTSVADLRPAAATTAALTLYRACSVGLVGGSSLTATLTHRKAVPRAAPPVVPGPGIVITGPDTPSLIVTVPRRT